MKTRKKWVVGGIIVLAILSLIGLSVQNSGERADSDKRKGAGTSDVIAIVRIEGVISDTGQNSIFGYPTGNPRLVNQLRELADDPTVKAVVLRINSPGGSASAAQEIGDQIDRIRKNGKIVVASMGEMAASGGYWVAAKSDRIVANPATMTGSIGVIMEFAQLTELYDKIGYQTRIIKSGPHKDMGNPGREITPEENTILQSMIDDIYEQFVDVVAEGRKMPRQQVKVLADGRIYTGRQAKEAGLVDKLGNFYDAVDTAKELAGIQGEPEIREYGKMSPLEQLLGGLQGTAGGNILPGGLSQGDMERIWQLLVEKNHLGGVQ